MRPIILISLDKHIDLIQEAMSNWAVCKILSILAFVGSRTLLAGMIILNWIGRRNG